MTTGSAASNPRRIVLCVDDCGLSPAVDRAALALVDMGRASAASVLVDGPGWPGVAAGLRERPRETLEVGLHLNLTQALPGSRWQLPLPLLMLCAFARTIRVDRLRTEMLRQFDAFERGMRRGPDFVDGHQHVHQFPGVRDAVLDVLRERGGSPAAWVRICCAPRWPQPTSLPATARLKAKLIEQTGARALQQRLLSVGLASNRHLLGVRALDADATQFEVALRSWLAAASDGDLLMCHPASAPGPGDRVQRARAMEFALLSSPRFGQWLNDGQLAIATLRSIQR